MPSTKMTVLPETEHMITEAAAWVKTVLPTLDEKKYSRDWLETRLLQGLRDGVLTLSIKAVEAAETGDEIADAALRLVHAEMVGGAIPEWAPGHLQVWSYGQRAVLRAPNQRRRGRQWYDNWIRDLEICFLIALASTQFNLSPTRNREARRANRIPSGISVIVAALARNGIHLDESTVQENIWFGLMGELARRAMAERPPAAILARRTVIKNPI
jgi:hypothetical protein